MADPAPTLAPIAAPRPRGLARFDAWSERWSERVDAVLVKDVRQALRSRFFRVSFGLALTLTTLAGIITLLVAAASEGVQNAGGLPLFAATLACASVGAVALVPFSTFASMNAEVDEGALDHLSLTHLGPFAIVRGKFATALIQALLVYAVCVPYVGVAWSMGNLDPTVISGSLVLFFALSAAFSALGIAGSSLTGVRWVRMLVMAAFMLVVFVTGLWTVGTGMMFFLASRLRVGGTTPSNFGPFLWAAALLAFVPLCLAFATERIAHRETSTSTPLRVTASALAFAGVLFEAAWVWFEGPSAAVGVLSMTLVFVALPLVWVVAEREPLPRAVGAAPPRRGLRTWLAIPHLAGGGRGVLLATLLLGGLALAHAVICAVAAGKLTQELTQGVVAAALVWTFLAVPSGCFAPFSSRPAIPGIARVVTLFLPLLFKLGVLFVAIVVIGFAARDSSTLFLTSPFGLVDDVDPRGWPKHEGAWIALAFVMVFASAVNAPRVARGVRDVLRAQAEHVRARGAA